LIQPTNFYGIYMIGMLCTYRLRHSRFLWVSNACLKYTTIQLVCFFNLIGNNNISPTTEITFLGVLVWILILWCWFWSKCIYLEKQLHRTPLEIGLKC